MKDVSQIKTSPLTVDEIVEGVNVHAITKNQAKKYLEIIASKAESSAWKAGYSKGWNDRKQIVSPSTTEEKEDA